MQARGKLWYVKCTYKSFLRWQVSALEFFPALIFLAGSLLNDNYNWKWKLRKFFLTSLDRLWWTTCSWCNHCPHDTKNNQIEMLEWKLWFERRNYIEVSYVLLWELQAEDIGECKIFLGMDPALFDEILQVIEVHILREVELTVTQEWITHIFNIYKNLWKNLCHNLFQISVKLFTCN